MKALEILSHIESLFADGKIVPDRLSALAEGISQKELPTPHTPFEQLFPGE